MWINREIMKIIKTEASTRPAVVLTGARQVGKTSLLRRLFPDHSFVSLDLPSEAAQAEGDPEVFLKRFPAPVIIDEVQYAPQLFRHLKSVIDRKRDAGGQFILTGSQKFTLMKAVADSLAGRTSILELDTLSWSEIQRFHPNLTIEEGILRGGFPELHASPAIDHVQFYRSYVSTYLERDLTSMMKVNDLRDFERFLRACALRSGQLLNKSELAKDIGISPTTVSGWLSILQASNMIFLLEPWFSNKTKGLVKSPKLYLGDTGLLCFLMGILTIDELLRSPLLGAIWETFVFGEIRKQQSFHSGHWRIHFYRDRSREIDFVIDQGGRFTLWECKWTMQPGPSDGHSLSQVAASLGKEYVDRSEIICRTPNAFPIGAGISAINLMDVAKIIRG